MIKKLNQSRPLTIIFTTIFIFNQLLTMEKLKSNVESKVILNPLELTKNVCKNCIDIVKPNQKTIVEKLEDLKKFSCSLKLEPYLKKNISNILTEKFFEDDHNDNKEEAESSQNIRKLKNKINKLFIMDCFTVNISDELVKNYINNIINNYDKKFICIEEETGISQKDSNKKFIFNKIEIIIHKYYYKQYRISIDYLGFVKDFNRNIDKISQYSLFIINEIVNIINEFCNNHYTLPLIKEYIYMLTIGIGFLKSYLLFDFDNNYEKSINDLKREHNKLRHFASRLANLKIFKDKEECEKIRCEIYELKKIYKKKYFALFQPKIPTRNKIDFYQNDNIFVILDLIGVDNFTIYQTPRPNDFSLKIMHLCPTSLINFFTITFYLFYYPYKIKLKNFHISLFYLFDNIYKKNDKENNYKDKKQNKIYLNKNFQKLSKIIFYLLPLCPVKLKNLFTMIDKKRILINPNSHDYPIENSEKIINNIKENSERFSKIVRYLLILRIYGKNLYEKYLEEEKLKLDKEKQEKLELKV